MLSFWQRTVLCLQGEQNVQPKRNERGQVIRLPKIDFRIRDFLTTDRDILTYLYFCVVCYCRQLYDGKTKKILTGWTVTDVQRLPKIDFRIRDFLTTDRDIHTYLYFCVVCYCLQIYDGKTKEIQVGRLMTMMPWMALDFQKSPFE